MTWLARDSFVRRLLQGRGPLRRLSPFRLRMAWGLRPLSETWGFDRGKPVHRYYLEAFLGRHRTDVRGEVLEFADPHYATRFGGPQVRRISVLHKDGDDRAATVVADLTRPNDLPSDQYDCIICTHVLHLVFEVDVFVRELRRILKPGGVLLVAVPHVSMCDPALHELWRFTPEGLRRVLENAFDPGSVEVEAFGSSLTSAGEIRGAVEAEFTRSELAFSDPRFAVEVCARAVKRPAGAPA